jgi:hypothetical protein
MALSSQTIAGERVQHAHAEEGGTGQDIEKVEHGMAPGSATAAPHAARVAVFRR